MEWFDFYIYAFSAVYFAHHFFASDNPTIQQINAFGIFALGFFMRPIGSYVFGSLGDKIGRKSSMVISVVLMALGSFMIAALPTKEVAGDWAILLLLVARLIQGMSVGGEYGIAATYLSELADNGKRGFYSSFQYVTLIGGQLLAVLSISIMLFYFSDAEMKDYAWRILFVIGGILALGSLVVRSIMSESTQELHQHRDRGTFKALMRSWKPFFACGWYHKWRFFGILYDYHLHKNIYDRHCWYRSKYCKQYYALGAFGAYAHSAFVWVFGR